MSLFRYFLREQMRRRMYGRRPRRTYGWGHPPARSPWGRHGYGRRRQRTQVRVFGCCLPIPLGGLALLAGLRTAFNARRSR